MHIFRQCLGKSSSCVTNFYDVSWESLKNTEGHLKHCCSEFIARFDKHSMNHLDDKIFSLLKKRKDF